MVSSKPPPCLGLADADSVRHSFPADSYDRDMVDCIYNRGPLEASPAGFLGLTDVSQPLSIIDNQPKNKKIKHRSKLETISKEIKTGYKFIKEK